MYVRAKWKNRKALRFNAWRPDGSSFTLADRRMLSGIDLGSWKPHLACNYVVLRSQILYLKTHHRYEACFLCKLLCDSLKGFLKYNNSNGASRKHWTNIC